VKRVSLFYARIRSGDCANLINNIPKVIKKRPKTFIGSHSPTMELLCKNICEIIVVFRNGRTYKKYHNKSITIITIKITEQLYQINDWVDGSQWFPFL